MKAKKLIALLSQYDPDMEVSVSFSESEENPVHITSCGNKQPRCYQQLVELAPEGLIVLNHHHQISYMNPQALAMLGQTEDKLFFEPISCLLSTEDHQTLIQKLDHLKLVQQESLHTSLTKSDGGNLNVRLSITNIPSANGQYRGAILTLADPTVENDITKDIPDHDDQNHEKLDKKVELIPDYIQQLNDRQAALLDEKTSLEQTERIDATPYWHQEKYLYLIHPKKDGRRTRVYIGKKEDKIKQALAAIKRGKRYQELCQELEEIEQNLRTATFKLDSFLWELAKVPPDFHQGIK